MVFRSLLLALFSIGPVCIADPETKARAPELEKDAWAKTLNIVHARVDAKDVPLCVYTYGIGPKERPRRTRSLACTKPGEVQCPSLGDCYTRAISEKTQAETAFVDPEGKDRNRVRRGTSTTCSYETAGAGIAIVLGGDPQRTVCATPSVCRNDENRERIAYSRSACRTLFDGRRFPVEGTKEQLVVCPEIAECESADYRFRVDDVEVRDNGPLLAGPGH